jgi:hypothetical protein
MHNGKLIPRERIGLAAAGSSGSSSTRVPMPKMRTARKL